MRTIGFITSKKDGEFRRAILPEDILKNVQNPDRIYIETGYGDDINLCDEDYLKVGVNVVSREKVLDCDVICDVKLGDADYLDKIKKGKILFGWAHAVQNVDFTSKVIKLDATVIAWEEMFENGRYLFYKNREIAGEAAVLQAFRYCKKMPYDCKVAILGNGSTAKGALRVLHGLGAEVDIYARKNEDLFKKNMYFYDVLINCVMWDTSRKDRIIYKEDLKKMRKGTLIIDVSCDPHLEIETSHPTSISDPVYEVDGIMHYAVDNTPAMYSITVTKILSQGISKYIDCLTEENKNIVLENATVIEFGKIISEQIKEFRVANGYEIK